jgi:aspartyl-tRNA synthetase
VAKRRDHGGVAFLDLRDASGVVQVVARDEVLDDGGAHDLRNEYCVRSPVRCGCAPRATPTRPAHR